MKVKELIDRLSVLRDDAEVFVTIGDKQFGSITGVGNDMFRVVYIEAMECDKTVHDEGQHIANRISAIEISEIDEHIARLQALVDEEI